VKVRALISRDFDLAFEKCDRDPDADRAVIAAFPLGEKRPIRWRCI
jgi:hypothetical protein